MNVCLTAQSSVFRTMFTNKEFVENESRLVKLNDVKVEVVDQFLTFLYTGQFKNEDKVDGDDPRWVEMLPQLAYIADKV